MNAKARKAYDAQLEVALKDDEDGFTGALLLCCSPAITKTVFHSYECCSSRVHWGVPGQLAFRGTMRMLPHSQMYAMMQFRCK